ncbi:hypothetical protein [Brachybacterium sp. GCM10030252]|uniref:hypothetical protein n=1 Tax=Brachybacterium sp. GCM10030252 TaxID=3273380 RepID=UPI0036205E0E
MTFLHLLTLALGVLAAVAGADLLGRKSIGPWPIGLLALALVPVAGWLYSAWLAALTLGLALGAGVVMIASWTRTFVDRRRSRREMSRQQADARDRQLEVSNEGGR